MAKILFSEVRTKSFLYDEISAALLEEGHEIIWIVQNHLFKPENFSKVYCIDYPQKKDIRRAKQIEVDSDIIERVKKSDRMLNYFSKNANHYPYYFDKIRTILSEERPDIVFGELGNFHTHFICLLARKMEIPYYDIETSRYPNQRFSFHLYDKYCPIEISPNEKVEQDFIKNFLGAVNNRNIVPDYMDKNSDKLFVKIWIQLKYRIKLLIEYIRGEKFSTVSPLVFMYRKFATKVKYTRFKKTAVPLGKVQNLKSKGTKVLLYPMQMQPEFNLDVWGVEYRDQGNTIKKISNALPENWQLVVKLNPKCREDLNMNTLEGIQSRENISLLDPSVGMRKIDKLSDCVISVTGTVVLERVFNRKPVIALGDTFLSRENLVVKLNNFDELSNYLEKLSEIESKQASPEILFQELINRSLEGWITEPLNNPSVLQKENISKIVSGINKVIKKNVDSPS
ncbi:hypothetical protein NC796_20210 [Aliifodinibius sp. S!AR15-10]|uniref:hypothetical protein n=1 Tax=Aliifodinibius sp. S!AR15-10 TaxID=2950437 RepID=UPI00285A7AF7|nr:hypothetical protein [Aliifodinibius sp. S!AR15-10]MDR8393490.1 hypothetical protein [Aliifodinibius sp. S!AR15-10]